MKELLVGVVKLPQSLEAQIAPYLTIAIVYLTSSLPGLRLFYLMFSLVAFMYWTYKQKDELALVVFLLGSSFSYSSLNIWHNEVVPAMPVLLVVLSLLMRGVRIRVFSALLAALSVFLLLVFSVRNFFEVGMAPIIVDLLVLYSIPLAALRFKKISVNQFESSFSFCSLVALIKMVIFSLLGVENPLLSTYTEAKFLDVYDELTGFFLLFSIVLIFSSKRWRGVSIALLVSLVFHWMLSESWLGYYGIGSQVLFVLLVFMVCILAHLPFGLMALITILFAPLLGVGFADTEDLKLQQLMSVFNIQALLDIELLPHSVHVRMAEIWTFFDGNLWRQVFGGGLGGYINLIDYFPVFLGPDDYSVEQINSGKITSPHNLGYLMIKFGYLGCLLAVIFLFSVYRVTKRMDVIKFALYMTLCVFLILNLGFTLKISFLLGILWVVMRNCQRHDAV